MVCRTAEAGESATKHILLQANPRIDTELESASLAFVQILDMISRKLRDGAACKILRRPYVKPTARHLPLHHDSLHHPSVHISWPQAEMLRLYKPSSLCYDFERARDLKVARWAHDFTHDRMLQQRSERQPSHKKVTQAAQHRTVRLIMPYHPGLKGLCVALKVIFDSWSS